MIRPSDPIPAPIICRTCDTLNAPSIWYPDHCADCADSGRIDRDRRGAANDSVTFTGPDRRFCGEEKTR